MLRIESIRELGQSKEAKLLEVLKGCLYELPIDSENYYRAKQLVEQIEAGRA